jgi:N6-L-threonylcarbamoyladenine synthase
MLFLGLESSCDETAVAIVEDGRRIVAQRLISQIEVHRKFGGVVPEVAARRHLEVINDLVAEVLAEAAIDPRSLAGIACTNGPGLIGTLLVGLSCRQSFSLVLRCAPSCRGPYFCPCLRQLYRH